MHYKIFSLFVLCLTCFIGNIYSISNRPAISNPSNQSPDRRFYFYNPEILPHAANALGMVIPSAFYKPMGPSLGPSLAPVHFADYGGVEEEEEEEVEEHHEEKHPLQLFTLIKPPKMKHMKGKKKKKGHQHQHKKPFKQIKKYFKNCLPFKFRIIKKSDIDNNDDQFYQNIRTQLPYGYGDEYFPQPPDKQELAVISLNTSNISENGGRFPQVLHFLYPRYNIQQTHPKRIPTPRKTYRYARPPKRHIIRPLKNKPRRPWPKINPWRVAPAGKPVSEFPLKEPTPDAIGGSPPPSPLYNLYKDPRIPVSQTYVIDEQTEAPIYNKVTPEYVYPQPTTPTQINYYEDHWVKPTRKVEVNGYDTKKYNDPDYYRYGTYYNQDQLQVEKEYIQEEPQDNINYDTISHSYHNFATSTEKIVTVTPTTAWVPIPQQQHHRVGVNNKLENKQINYKSGGFKNLSNFETVKFGDKIIPSKNCSLSKKNCLEQIQNNPEQNKKIVNFRSSSKYNNKQKGVNSEIKKYSSQKKKPQETTTKNSNARFYIEEVSPKEKRNVTNPKIFSRSYKGIGNDMEIVTAKYPEDNLNEIYKHVTPSSSARGMRSNFKGFRAVVSGSMQVKEK